jgi:predicted Rossmann fold flavoprotein
MRRVVVVGAGAAGVMAAIFAAEAGAETTLVERTSDGGRKILISGGGRCNILPSRVDYSRFVSDSSRQLVRRIARSWPLEAQIAFFERDADLPLFEEPGSAKLFPRSQSGRQVRDALLALVRAKGASFVGASSVIDLCPRTGGWLVERQREAPIEADAVVLATGGLSVPSTGSDGRGLEIVRRLGHTIHPTYAALTPLTGTAFAHLSGISLPVTVTARSANRSASATGGFLFTHRGYSGPAILDVSHVAVRSREEPAPAEIRVRWSHSGHDEWDRLLRASGPQTVVAAISRVLPNRLTEALIHDAQVERSRTLAQLTRAERVRLVDTLVNGQLPWDGDEGYRKAEVTGGGVSLDEIDPRTMESRKHRGLFLCGEMLDAFGPIGGYNFLWAWATGRAAGIGAALPWSQT